MSLGVAGVSDLLPFFLSAPHVPHLPSFCIRNRSVVCEDGAAHKDERPHPPTISAADPPAGGPAASVMSEALWPDPRPYPYFSPVLRLHPPYACGTLGQWCAGAGQTWPRLTLLVKSRQSISNAMGIHRIRGMALVSLAFKRRIQDRFLTYF
jgi:hypothetical protein